jgi:phage terminase large subunit-like protein
VTAALAEAGPARWAGQASTFIERAIRYAEDSLSGAIAAGKWHKAACRRFLDDLDRQGDPDFPYELNAAAADRICNFAQLMPHVEGEWAKPRLVDGAMRPQRIRLEDWQAFLLVNLFGWIHTSTGLRRFRRWYEEVARKNGKSPIGAVICNYLTFADGEPGAQVYSFATKKEQAKVVWGTAKAMVQKEPDFAQLGAAYNTQALYSLTTHSSFKPLARDHGSLDGLNTHGFLADELHAQKERGLWDVMDSSTGARAQPLGGGITTAGSDRSGICYEIRAYVCKILSGVLRRHEGLGYKIDGEAIDDDTWFGIIYTLDEADDPFDEACWPKANPNLNVSVKIDDMRAQARKARIMASALTEFLTKRLNIWVNASVAWMDMSAWERCADPEVKPEAFAGEECWDGLDLATRKDICAKVRVFKRLVDGKWHYYALGVYYLPEAAIEASGNAQYKGWVRDRHLVQTDGNVTDFDVVKDDLRADATMFQVQECAFDSWNAQQLANEMQDEGMVMVEMRQGAKTLSEPMKKLEELVLQGRFHHDGNPALAWMISNTLAKADENDNIRPDKDRYENKIDGTVALIMALGRAALSEPSQDVSEVMTV